MHVRADLCVIPVGEGASVSSHVKKAVDILAKFSISIKTHAYGTNIEGDWDEVFSAIKAVHADLHASGVARLSSSMRFGTRTDKHQTMQDKVDAVQS